MTWWRRLLKRDQMEERLEAELRFHLERQVADKVRGGMTEAEARRSARLEFGGLDQVKEECRDARGTRWVEAILQDLRFGLRTLRRSPAFTAVAALTLALGIGANTAVFTVVNGVLLRPLPFPEPEKLFLISYLPRNNPFLTQPGLDDRDYLEFLRQDQVFEHIATSSSTPLTLTGAGDPVRVPAAAVTSGFFPAVGVNPAIGRWFLPEEDQPGREPVAVLSDKLWQSRFGADSHVLGKSITLDGIAHTVVGVMPLGFGFPGDAEMWTPLAVQIDPHNSYTRPVLGRLKPGISRQRAQAELETFASRLPLGPGEKRSDFVARIIPLKDSVVGNIRSSLLIFAGAVAFVLLIACANFANLLLIRAAGRRQEISVRAALGAGRGRLVRQLLTESTLVALAGGAAGMLLATIGVPALLALAPTGKIPRIDEIRMDAWVLAFTVAVSVMTGIVFGLAPALGATGRGLRESLSGSGRTLTGRHGGFRSVLVVSEIALALVLLAGAGLMLKSFLRIRAVNPGFHAKNVLTMAVELPESTYQTAAQMRAFHQRTLEKLASLPGVLVAGAVNWLPLGQWWVKGDFRLEGGVHSHYNVLKPAVSPGYFQTIGIRMRSGRDFTERDIATAPGVVIVSQLVAKRFWPGEDPIGRRISMEDDPKPEDWLTIVGVVDDVRQLGLTDQPEPAIYQPYLQVTRTFFLGHMTFAVRTASNPQSMATAVRGVLRSLDKNQPVQSISTMEDVVTATTTEPRFQTRLLAVFATLALVLAAIGVYGVLAYSVSERTHEIGIRIALGAGTGNVMGMVFRNSLTLAAAGVSLGTAGALVVTRVLEKYLFDVKPTDPATFAVVALLLAGIALLAGCIPARRATKVDPVVALRFE